MSDDSKTWQMIHSERAKLADTLEALSAEQWATPSLCGGWSVRIAAAHVLVGGEQTPAGFFKAMAANGFRFNTMIDRVAHARGSLAPQEIVDRLRATTKTTNRPPAPVATMLGEVVVHGEDILRPLGLPKQASTDSTLACLELFKRASFPLGSKKRIAGLRLTATDMAWSHGTGPEVAGPGQLLLLGMTGRSTDFQELSGEGAPVLIGRISAARS